MITKFWKVLDLNTRFPNLYYHLACKDIEGKIHIFGLNDNWTYATINEETAKKNYCFCEEKPVSYSEVLRLEKHWTLKIKLEEVKRIYEIIS